MRTRRAETHRMSWSAELCWDSIIITSVPQICRWAELMYILATYANVHCLNTHSRTITLSITLNAGYPRIVYINRDNIPPLWYWNEFLFIKIYTYIRMTRVIQPWKKFWNWKTRDEPKGSNRFQIFLWTNSQAEIVRGFYPAVRVHTNHKEIWTMFIGGTWILSLLFPFLCLHMNLSSPGTVQVWKTMRCNQATHK